MARTANPDTAVAVGTALRCRPLLDVGDDVPIRPKTWTPDLGRLRFYCSNLRPGKPLFSSRFSRRFEAALRYGRFIRK